MNMLSARLRPMMHAQGKEPALFLKRRMIFEGQRRSVITRMVCAGVIALTALVAGPGCGGGGSSTPGGNNGSAITRIALSSAGQALSPGQSITLTATAYNAAGAVVNVNGDNWAWSTTDARALTVATQGNTATATAQQAGSATVRVRETRSGQEVQATFTVSAPPTGGTPDPGTPDPGNPDPGNPNPGNPDPGTPNPGTPNPGTPDPGIPSGATVIYSNDFEAAGGAGSEWSQRTVSTTPVGGRRFLGEFASGTARLSLGNLPAHSRIRVRFSLYVLRSWDGNSVGNGPDLLNVDVENGPRLLSSTFSNFDGFVQSYPGSFGAAEVPGLTGAAERNTLGYTYGNEPRDAVYQLSYTFPHASNSLVLRIAHPTGEPIANESWGIDNVEVTAIP